MKINRHALCVGENETKEQKEAFHDRSLSSLLLEVAGNGHIFPIHLRIMHQDYDEHISPYVHNRFFMIP
jgi:hypothetical protein